MIGNPRREIEHFIEKGDLEALLRKAAELHGHFCSYLAYGVKAGYIAVKELGIKSNGMEELIAIVETNNCFSDGIQIVWLHLRKQWTYLQRRWQNSGNCG